MLKHSFHVRAGGMQPVQVPAKVGVALVAMVDQRWDNPDAWPSYAVVAIADSDTAVAIGDNSDHQLRELAGFEPMAAAIEMATCDQAQPTSRLFGAWGPKPMLVGVAALGHAWPMAEVWAGGNNIQIWFGFVTSPGPEQGYAEGPQERAMTPDQLQTYHDAGWVVIPEVVDPSLMAALRADLDGLHDRQRAQPVDGTGVVWEHEYPERIHQLMNSELVSPIIDDLTRNQRLLDAIEAIVGPDVLLFHSKLMMKSAGTGGTTPWHQDWGYWRHHSAEPTHCNAMLAIDAHGPSNGGLQIVSGSHKDGPVDHRHVTTTAFSTGLSDDMSAFQATPVIMQPGDMVFFGPMVIHGSGPNTGDQPRRANTFAFDRPGNRTPELPQHRLRRGTWPTELVGADTYDWR